MSKTTQYSCALNDFSGLFSTHVVKKPKKLKAYFMTTAASIFLLTVIIIGITLNAFFTLPSTSLENNKVYSTKVGEQASYKLQDG